MIHERLHSPNCRWWLADWQPTVVADRFAIEPFQWEGRILRHLPRAYPNPGEDVPSTILVLLPFLRKHLRHKGRPLDLILFMSSMQLYVIIARCAKRGPVQSFLCDFMWNPHAMRDQVQSQSHTSCIWDAPLNVVEDGHSSAARDRHPHQKSRPPSKGDPSTSNP